MRDRGTKEKKNETGKRREGDAYVLRTSESQINVKQETRAASIRLRGCSTFARAIVATAVIVIKRHDHNHNYNYHARHYYGYRYRRYRCRDLQHSRLSARWDGAGERGG